MASISARESRREARVCALPGGSQANRADAKRHPQKNAPFEKNF
jgi:hypothetical protein